ncbi:uncharacterized protein LOC143181396 [Calliopsis andreniformis]|uniref:uncharacterized protein LOC143181396 n=1 Tax=Calliopsis andreniformis TaxID=337506 RepID=UPI003FCCAEA1
MVDEHLAEKKGSPRASFTSGPDRGHCRARGQGRCVESSSRSSRRKGGRKLRSRRPLGPLDGALGPRRRSSREIRRPDSSRSERTSRAVEISEGRVQRLRYPEDGIRERLRKREKERERGRLQGEERLEGRRWTKVMPEKRTTRRRRKRYFYCDGNAQRWSRSNFARVSREGSWPVGVDDRISSVQT